MPINMSYCRFSNTLEALKECDDVITEDSDLLSDRERKARKKLIALCQSIASWAETYEE